MWQITAAPRLARSAFVVAGVTGAVLVALSGGYGYHRDELYFLVAGAHPDWGYPDQPPLTPLLAWATTSLFGDSLVALRLPSALAIATVVLFLPVVPPSALAGTPIPEVNTDAGATLGWPELAGTVADVHRDLPPDERHRAVILTENYGEAGALEQARSRLALPAVFSGHMGFGEWGPPPDGATPTIAVGLDRAALDELFVSVTPAARIDNGIGLDTEERGRTVWICREQRRPWSQAWRQLRHIG